MKLQWAERMRQQIETVLALHDRRRVLPVPARELAAPAALIAAGPPFGGDKPSGNALIA